MMTSVRRGTNRSNGTTRRHFLARSAAAVVAAPYIIPACARSNNSRVAPSNRVTVAGIGMGNRMMKAIMPHFLAQHDVQYVAVSDCFAGRRQSAKATVDHYYGNTDCIATRHHEEIIERDDIDAVLIATGDRWHAVLSALAASVGKDVYCEKPFTLTIDEGWKMVNTMKRFGTVWQCGMQRRSVDSYRFVAEVVRSGMIGNLRTMTTLLGSWPQRGTLALPEPMPDPEVFDYDRWLGQAPWTPYSKVRVAGWRHRWDTGGGVLCDMGPHYFDISQWANDTQMSGPVEFEATDKTTWQEGGFYQMPVGFKVEARYENNVKLVITTGPKGIRFDGDEGWIHIGDEGGITAAPESILRDRSRILTRSYRDMGGHVRNFLDCMRSRKLTASHPELAQRSHVICHCANICLRLGRKVQWDNESQRFISDEDANNMLTRTMRAPWRI